MTLKSLCAICVGFSLGILTFVFQHIFFGTSIFLLVCFLFCIFLLKPEKRKSYFLLFMLLLVMGILGFTYTFIRERKPSQILLEKKETPVMLVGRVVSNPIVSENKTDFQFKTDEGKIKTTIFSQQDISFGDTLIVKGLIKQPENFQTETGKVFDYVNYLGKDRIFFTMVATESTHVNHAKFSFRKELFSLFNKANNLLKENVKTPFNALVQGVLLGNDTFMGKEMKENFIKTGTIHIVALSGYNISILLTWVLFVSRRYFTYRWGTILALTAVLIFVVGTGGSQTAVRAGIMGSLALIANYYGRSQLAIRLLLLTYIAMLVINPFTLPYDISFHLSFLATFGIISFQKKMESYVAFLPRSLREIFGTTLSAQLLVLPYLVFVFGQLSVSSIPVNVIIAPLVPLLMLLSALVIFCGIFFVPLTVFAGFLTTKVSALIVLIVNFFARLSYSYITVSSLSVWLIFGYYFFIIVWYFSLQKKEND